MEPCTNCRAHSECANNLFRANQHAKAGDYLAGVAEELIREFPDNTAFQRLADAVKSQRVARDHGYFHYRKNVRTGRIEPDSLGGS